MDLYRDYDRQALRARAAELLWKVPPPSYETLYKIIPACRDEEFRRGKMEYALGGLQSLRIQAICDIAVQIPWVPNQELSRTKLVTHGIMSKVLTGLGIIAYLCLVCYVVRRYFQVC